MENLTGYNATYGRLYSFGESDESRNRGMATIRAYAEHRIISIGLNRYAVVYDAVSTF